jgi:hypothetical protein
MRGGDFAAIACREYHGQAIGGKDSKHGAGARGHRCVGFGFVAAGFADDARAVYLPQPTRRRWQTGALDQFGAVACDDVGIVAIGRTGVAEVEGVEWRLRRAGAGAQGGEGVDVRRSIPLRRQQEALLLLEAPLPQAGEGLG